MEDNKNIDNTHPDYSKKALLLCKIIPGPTQDAYLQRMLLDDIFFLAFFEIYFYVCFLMQIIEITRTLADTVVYFVSY